MGEKNSDQFKDFMGAAPLLVLCFQGFHLSTLVRGDSAEGTGVNLMLVNPCF